MPLPSVATKKRTSAGRSRRPVPFTVPHYREWGRGLVLDNEEQYEVEDYFALFLSDFFAGFKLCWLVVPEENAKTTNVAALCLYITEFMRNARIPVAASSRDQAEWLYVQAEGLVKNSGLEDETRSTGARTTVPHRWRCLEGYRRIRHDATESRIQIFAADDRGGDGVIPGGVCVIDELHRHRSLKLYRTWLGKLRKRDAQLIVMSTAGEVGSEFEKARAGLLSTATATKRRGRCFVRAEKTMGRKRLSVIHDYAVPKDADLEDFELVAEANPFSGITAETVAEKYEMADDLHHFARFTANIAVRSVDAAITEMEWAQQYTERGIPVGEGIYAGLDVAWKWDTTALVPFWPESQTFRLLGRPTILEPPRNGNMLDSALIEQALLDLNSTNPIHTLVMDVSNAEQLAQWAERELGCVVVDRQQSVPLQVLDYKRFMEALRQRWLWHVGDPGLTQHAMNAIAKRLPGGDAKFERPAQGRQTTQEQQQRRVIDALTASCLVHTTYTGDLEPEEEGDSWKAV